MSESSPRHKVISSPIVSVCPRYHLSLTFCENWWVSLALVIKWYRLLLFQVAPGIIYPSLISLLWELVSESSPRHKVISSPIVSGCPRYHLSLTFCENWWVSLALVIKWYRLLLFQVAPGIIYPSLISLLWELVSESSPRHKVISSPIVSGCPRYHLSLTFCENWWASLALVIKWYRLLLFQFAPGIIYPSLSVRTGERV